MSRKPRKQTRRQRRRTRNTRRVTRGGTTATCYGTGVGANNYDPNLSLYNTRLPQLFPFRT